MQEFTEKINTTYPRFSNSSPVSQPAGVTAYIITGLLGNEFLEKCDRASVSREHIQPKPNKKLIGQ